MIEALGDMSVTERSYMIRDQVWSTLPEDMWESADGRESTLLMSTLEKYKIVISSYKCV